MAGTRERAARVLDCGPLGEMLRRVPFWRGLITLNYHRVVSGTADLFDRGVWSATPQALDAQVAFLKRHFDVVGPPDLPDVLQRGNGRYVLLTFDDGYRDTFEVAYPILRSHGVRATVFITTGFLDRPRLSWWDEIAWMVRASRQRSVRPAGWLSAALSLAEPDREHAVRVLLARFKELSGAQTNAFLDFVAEETGSGRADTQTGADVWMTWQMARQMRAAGMWLGGHTVSHPILARLPRHQQQEEIAECRRRFEAEIGEPMDAFAYPSGKPGTFDQATRECLQHEGVRLAFRFSGGYSRFDTWDPYGIARMHVGVGMSSSYFRAMMALPRLFSRE